MRRFSLLLLLPLAIYGCLYAVALLFYEPVSYNKDFASPYLMARALLDGANPYQPLPDLARQYLGVADFAYWPHATPHPLLMGLLYVPLALLSYPSALLVWRLIEIACLCEFLFRLRHWFGAQWGGWLAVLAPGVLLCWSAVQVELRWGQINLLLLLLLTLSLYWLEKGREGAAGVALGLALSLKMLGWPIVIWLLLRRRWRPALSAVGVFVASNLLAVAWLGWGWLAEYYGRIGPSVAAHYRSHEANYSLWTLGHRWFLGVSLDASTQIAPLYHSETLARIVGPGVVLLALALGLCLAWRAGNQAQAFGLLVVVSLLIAPALWPHYFVIALLPAALVAGRLMAQGWQRRDVAWALLVLALLVPARDVWIEAARLGAVDGVIGGWAGLITLAPVVGLVALAWAAGWRALGGETDTI